MAVTPVVTTTTDFGVGDVSTFVDGDLDPTFASLDQERSVMESVARGWISPQGSIPWAPSDGDDIRQMISAKLSPAKLLDWTVRLETSALADERVLSCDVTITVGSDAKSVSIHGAIETASGPFSLTLAVDALTISLLNQ